MKIKNSIYLYTTILIFTILFLYTITHFLGIFQKQYFAVHSEELTTAVLIDSTDSSQGYNYFYKKTPFDYSYQILTYISLIIPLILLFNFSITEFRKKKDKENYFHTLLFPTVYALINILMFLLFADKSTGWEYTYGLYITIAWSILIFIILAVTNLVTLSEKQKEIKQ